jgi:hypothetical protein
MAAIKAIQASPELLASTASEYRLLCTILGISHNDKKDDCGTEVILLGRLVNSVTRTVSVPQDKLDRIVALATEALGQNSMTFKEATSLAGLLSFCAPAVQLGFVFCRRLWTFTASFQSHWNAPARRRIPAAVREDLLWWQGLFPKFNGTRFFDDTNRLLVHLFADASIVGTGAFYLDNVQTVSCDWQDHLHCLPVSNTLARALPPRDNSKPFDINPYEISAVLQAIEQWGVSWRGKKLIIHTDSSTTQLGITKSTLKSPAQNEPLRKIFLCAAQNDIVLHAVHLPGEENGLADALSRNLTEKIANWCPHWQMSSHLTRPQ